jgi:transposase-like protein
MNKHFKTNERELVKVASFFKRQSRKLIDEGKLGEENAKVGEAVDRFIEQMESHADIRAQILDQREALKKLVRDNAVCPRCNTGDKIKLVGTEKNSKGWKSNRYRCRKCNVDFTWNRPNNPWDMIKFIEEMIDMLVTKLSDPGVSELEKSHIETGLVNMRENLDKLKPVIEAHDAEYDAIQTRDAEMEQLIHEFKNSLLIERIKMDSWENRKNPGKS